MEVTKIKIALRLLGVFLIIFVFSIDAVLSHSLIDAIAYSSKYFTFMATYRYPMILGNNYYKHILGIGDQTNVKNNIALLSDSMTKLLTEPDVIRTVYDTTINKPKWYSPFIANSLNQNLSYSQIDLFY
jgi:hypothetical protein